MLSKVKANSWILANCQRSVRITAVLRSHYIQHLRTRSLRNFLSVVSTNMSRRHSELPVRILTTGECTRNRLTLFGNATVHCKRGIFYEEQFIRHLVWMLHGGQSSDVTLHRPTLASGATADRSDVYSGSVKIQGPVSYRIVYH